VTALGPEPRPRGRPALTAYRARRTDPDPGPHLRHWEATSLAMESGSGGGRGEATRNIYYSVRRLPPGHDPGAARGEAPVGRQRGSRPCNILVEGRGGDRPRHEVREVRISTIEMNIARRRPDPTRRTSERAEARRSRPRLRPRKTGCRCRDHVAHGAHGVTRPPWARDQGSPRPGDHGRHSGHGDEDGDAPAVITAITAPTAAHAPRGA